MWRIGQAMSAGDSAAVATWIQQRLEAMVVLPVDQGDVDRRAAQRFGGLDAPKPAPTITTFGRCRAMRFPPLRLAQYLGAAAESSHLSESVGNNQRHLANLANRVLPRPSAWPV